MTGFFLLSCKRKTRLILAVSIRAEVFFSPEKFKHCSKIIAVLKLFIAPQARFTSQKRLIEFGPCRLYNDFGGSIQADNGGYHGCGKTTPYVYQLLAD